MDQQQRKALEQPPEITRLDAHIAKAGGTSSGLDMMSHRLKDAKKTNNRTTEDLVRENSYLREEIVFYKEARNAMAAFHAKIFQSFGILQSALKDVSDKMAASEENLLEYWGVDLNSLGEEDLTVV